MTEGINKKKIKKLLLYLVFGNRWQVKIRILERGLENNFPPKTLKEGWWWIYYWKSLLGISLFYLCLTLLSEHKPSTRESHPSRSYSFSSLHPGAGLSQNRHFLLKVILCDLPFSLRFLKSMTVVWQFKCNLIKTLTMLFSNLSH